MSSSRLFWAIAGATIGVLPLFVLLIVDVPVDPPLQEPTRVEKLLAPGPTVTVQCAPRYYRGGLDLGCSTNPPTAGRWSLYSYEFGGLVFHRESQFFSVDATIRIHSDPGPLLHVKFRGKDRGPFFALDIPVDASYMRPGIRL